MPSPPPAESHRQNATNQEPAQQQQQPRKINLDALLKLHLDDDFGADAGVRPAIPPGSDYVEPDPNLKGAAHCVFEAENSAKIYLGSKKASDRDASESLELLGIGGIVNCTNNLACYHRPSIKYCCVPVNDIETATISDYFRGATAFVHHLLSGGCSVVVHCQFGVSRSATIVLAYLMRYHGASRDQAYIRIKQKRPKIHPNDGFWKQLRAFEAELQTNQNPPTEPNDGRLLLHETDIQTTTTLDECMVLFSTWRDVPELLDDTACWSWLQQQHQTRDDVLNAALDFIWGRGLGDNDLEWLRCVCDRVEISGDESSIDRAFCILEDPQSEFCERWAGEVTSCQIQTVQRFLLSSD